MRILIQNHACKSLVFSINFGLTLSVLGKENHRPPALKRKSHEWSFLNLFLHKQENTAHIVHSIHITNSYKTILGMKYGHVRKNETIKYKDKLKTCRSSNDWWLDEVIEGSQFPWLSYFVLKLVSFVKVDPKELGRAAHSYVISWRFSGSSQLCNHKS